MAISKQNKHPKIKKIPVGEKLKYQCSTPIVGFCKLKVKRLNLPEK